MADLPNGIVTFAFTDVEGSTRLWEEAPDQMREALDSLDRLATKAAEGFGGFVVKPRGEGDSHFLVFETAQGAIAGIAKLQRSIASTNWPTPRPVRIRAALHTGSAEMSAGDYYGSAVNRTARLRSIAHGGQTVVSRATWELAVDAQVDDVRFEDMGEHRLKDLTRAEQVFQMVVEGLPSDFPPLKSLRDTPNNLPEQLTDFIGRSTELADVKSILAGSRLITLLAPGGSGKTRLAIQVAADLSDEFKDGVFFIGLSEIGSSAEIVQSVAEALGLGLSADDDLDAQLLNYLSNKEQLLVFDNFEHVSDGAAIVSSILQRASSVKVIATSRSKLNVSGETVVSISGLETTWENPAEAHQTSGVRLFVDAARRSNPGFELADGDLEPLAEILALIDGMPLAILLAASWVDVLSVPEISDEISKSLDFLETELGDVPDRHRSVRAVFDYSWALLDEGQRSVFSRLSVFRGGFTREAAAEVAGASLRNLSTLVGKSLITADLEGGRYSVHEMLRQFAEDQFREDTETWEATLDRHATFYADLVEDATELLTKADQVRMASIIESDLDNVRYAWRRVLATGEGEAGLKMLRGLYFLYEWRGWFPSAVGLFGEALDQLDASDSDESCQRLRAMSLSAQSWFRTMIGQAEEGCAGAVKAKSILTESALDIDHWIARQVMALGYGYTGAVEALIRVTEEGIALTASMEDEMYGAGMKNWRSFAALSGEDPKVASRLLAEAMEVFERRDEHYFMTWTLWLQALLALGSGHAVEAIGLFERQVARAEQLGYLRGRVVGLEGLGDANSAAGRHEEARFAYVGSLTTADQMGMVADMLGLMVKIGEVLASEDRQAEAVEILSTVCSEPLSNQMAFGSSISIRDSATSMLKELGRDLEESAYAEAARIGDSRDWEASAKALMDNSGRMTTTR